MVAHMCLNVTLLIHCLSCLASYAQELFQAQFTYHRQYNGCPKSTQPFWISREPVKWPWGNLAASQRRPYCASM